MTSPPLTTREYAYFKIVGKGDHSVVTQKLGIEPTNEWSEGDLNPRNNMPRKFMHWQFESGFDDTHPIEEHLNKLFAVLEPLKSSLLELNQNYDLYLQCVGYFPPSGHGIHLDHQMVVKAAELGLAFDLDFYYVSDHGHDLDYH